MHAIKKRNIYIYECIECFQLTLYNVYAAEIVRVERLYYYYYYYDISYNCSNIDYDLNNIVLKNVQKLFLVYYF